MYDYEEITGVLVKNNKIEDGEIVYQIGNLPEIFEGNEEQIINDSNYFKLEVSEIDNTLLNYWGKNNTLFLFIKK